MNDDTYRKLREISKHMKVIPMSELRELREIDEQRTRASVVLGTVVFDRVSSIVDKEPQYKRAAYYETICKAALAGYDFSAVESIKDIADVYAHYFVRSIVNDWRE